MTIPNQMRRLNQAFHRHILKPASEKLRTKFLHTEMLSAHTWKRMPRYVVYAAAFCTLFVTMWTLYPVTLEEEGVTLGLSSSEFVKAVFKSAHENPDGTVDLVFNVPKGGKDLLQLNGAEMSALEAMSELQGNTTTVGQQTTTATTLVSRPIKTKSLYPISLDADYVINSVNICPRGQAVDYLIVVHSATAYFIRRRTIRETYGGKGLFGKIFQRVVFLLGTTNDPAVARSIQEEAFLYRDIVQGQFLDSYHNLTHKGVLGYRWVSQFCPQAKLIVKIDDDVFINPFKLVQEALPLYMSKTRHIACQLRHSGTSPIVRGTGRWLVHEDEFRGHNTYPFDYCNGYFVIITGDLIRPMLNAARLNPFFWIDDVYIFGMLPATVGSVKFVDIVSNLSLAFKSGKDCFDRDGIQCKFLAVSHWVAEQPETFWYMMLSNLTSSERAELQVFNFSRPSDNY